MHKSEPVLTSPCEFINVIPVNPLISKCQIKVCYVGEEPNRNRSIITKEVAREMANSLPGSPIVGFFNEANGDFEEHNRSIEIANGEFKIKDITRPYGFVDLNAKCWFKKFVDDDAVEHEYLMTEGYLWTGQYPEAQRILEHGNNQSMELDNEKIKAEWTKDDNGKPQFFIINEAIISKLCILGEDFEPCFEGSNITKVQFSLDEDFTSQMTNFVKEMKEILSKGGAQVENTEFEKVEEVVEEISVEEVEVEVSAEEPQDAPEEASEMDFKKDDQEEPKEEEEKPEEGKEEEPSEEEDSESKGEEEPEEKKEDKDDKQKKYSLEDVVEYTELSDKYSELEAQYNSLLTEVSALREFKLVAERKDKEAMIAKFYVLSDEDKKDVVENIETYSLDEIEAKLSVIYVRNGISFEVEEEKQADEPIVYNLDSHEAEDSSIPAWVKAVMETEKTLN